MTQKGPGWNHKQQNVGEAKANEIEDEQNR